MRIVSLLPSATEILYSLQLSHQVVGVTAGCDYPPAVRQKAVVVRSALPDHSLTGAEIHRRASEARRSGGSLYLLEEEQLRQLQPDLIITQALCDVCAVSHGQVQALTHIMEKPPQVLSLNATSLEEILNDIRRVATAADVPERGKELIQQLRQRLEAVRGRHKRSEHQPSVVCLEWLDPPFAAGHWVPDMVAAAGGRERLGRSGRPSYPVHWEEVAAADPEVLILIPCGFNARETLTRLHEATRSPVWGSLRAVRTGRVYALNADAYFSRPGPRVVTGTEHLAMALHAETSEPGVAGEEVIGIAPHLR